MNEERIQQIKDRLRELIRRVAEMGEEPPEEIQDLLIQVIAKAQREIEELRAQGGAPGLPPTQPPIQPGMPSSNVEGFARDENTGKLYVRFLGKHPNRQGPVYEYSGVPDSMYNLFRRGAVPARTNGQNKWGKWWKGKVPSMGASVYTLLKQGGFDYRRVS